MALHGLQCCQLMDKYYNFTIPATPWHTMKGLIALAVDTINCSQTAPRQCSALQFPAVNQKVLPELPLASGSSLALLSSATHSTVWCWVAQTHSMCIVFSLFNTSQSSQTAGLDNVGFSKGATWPLEYGLGRIFRGYFEALPPRRRGRRPGSVVDGGGGGGVWPWLIGRCSAFSQAEGRARRGWPDTCSQCSWSLSSH